MFGCVVVAYYAVGLDGGCDSQVDTFIHIIGIQWHVFM
jgi:hypothetical protein